MKVRLSPYPHHFGVKTEVDGQELPEVRSINLGCKPGELPVLTVSMNALDVDVELDAGVTIVLHAEEGEQVEVEQVSDKKQRLRTLKRQYPLGGVSSAVSTEKA